MMDDCGENGECGVCGMVGPLEEIQNHFLAQHVDNENITHNEEDEQNNDNQMRLWTRENTLLLIRLVEENQEMFANTLKKKVWVKVANEMNKVTGKIFTHEHIDNKWKGLKKTYKKIKDHNNKSGNNARKWEYFYAMDEFMKKKPEIVPLAVCSSTNGLIRNNGGYLTTNDQNQNDVSKMPEDSDASSSAAQDYESSFMMKRKRTASTAQKRHDEKIARYDQFLKLFKISVEHQTGKEIDM